MGNGTTSTMTQYPTQPNYPVTELTSCYPMLVMPSAKLGSKKYYISKNSLAFQDSVLTITPSRLPCINHNATHAYLSMPPLA